MVLALPLALVFVVAHLLGTGGGTGSPGGPSARPVDAEQSTATTGTTGASAASGASDAVTPSSAAPTSRSQATPAGTEPSAPLAEPTGRCANSDIVAVPNVQSPAYAGRPVILRTTLTTKRSPACDWTVSAGSLVVKVTSGADRVWSTQDCVGAVPRESVVVRKDHPVTVAVVWDGQRSDAECSLTTPWAETGYYHAVAAAFGSDPSDQQFQLVRLPTRTVTAKPRPEHAGARPTATPVGPTATPTGATAAPTRR